MWIRYLFDPWVKNKDSDPGSVSGINIPEYIYESLETIFGLKIFEFFYAGPGSGIFLTLDPGSGWKSSNLVSGTNIQDPEHFFTTINLFWYPLVRLLTYSTWGFVCDPKSKAVSLSWRMLVGK